MTMLPGIVNQYNQIKYNFNAVLSTFGMSLQENTVKVICYVNAVANYSEIESMFTSDFQHTQNFVYRVGRLPRDALVELEVLSYKKQ